MNQQHITINGIPALIWGAPSDRVCLFVHGKLSSKEAAAGLARIADERGIQVLSFDLPEHGERVSQPDRCDIRNGIRDLSIIGDYVFARWHKASLYGCSLGAYFSLHAYADRAFDNCLFQSPIVDMEYLIRQMMRWFGITEERLKSEKEIPTPVDIMSWDYYRYVLEHPIQSWNIRTHILYAGRDNMQSREVIQSFTDRFSCRLSIAEQSEHAFMGKDDDSIVSAWMQESLG